MNIIKSSTSMRKEAKQESSLETECLFGEKIEIIDEKLDWVYCKLLTDNYCGWIKKSSLGKLEKLTHRVLNKGTFIYKDASSKSDILMYIPMGSRVAIKNVAFGWSKTVLTLRGKSQVGYIPDNHIVFIEHKVKDWVKIAETLVGTPYRWGGRSTIGIDCSALLQLSYQTFGQNIPRNTSEQITVNKKIIKDVNNLFRGCVVFWKGHVGIMIDNVNLIHANAFHMKTTIEPLSNVIKRIGNDLKILKMMDFN